MHAPCCACCACHAEYADLESNSEEQNALANPGQPVDQQECVLLPENEVSFFMETAINSIATLSLYGAHGLGWVAPG